ncbi:MAG: endopeptidase La [Clostridia bacterium]|nr:endopeptidase La [Clostridia bacterium]
MVPLRGLVVFPDMALHFDIGRPSSMAAVEHCLMEGETVFLTAQKDAQEENPDFGDVHPVGTVARVKQVLKLPGDSMRVLVEGIERGRLVAMDDTQSYLTAEVEVESEEVTRPSDLIRQEAYVRNIATLFERYVILGGRVPAETLFAISEIESPGRFADTIAANVVTEVDEKQQVLNCISPLERLETVMRLLSREIERLEIDKEIAQSVRQQLDRSQREYFLREQIKAIQQQLGEADENGDDAEQLRARIEAAPLPDEARETALKELRRMDKISPSSPEYDVVRTYLENILDLPWGEYTEDNLDLANARQVLDSEHTGLKKVKDRIIEFLAVRKLKSDSRGPILCLAGPPGVGKTSIARSVAHALGKEFARMSLGGVRDEAEIRGHRRTYIGAIPGRIVTSIQRAGKMNPVFLLDEIDKMASDFRGDPASAMLEVLDPEINSTFRDHYLDIPFDLSGVMFITTANDVSAIPAPLHDRMEIIELDSYTDVEKLAIAREHLLGKQEKEHGIAPGIVEIGDDVIMDIIHHYTAESGVRSLERELAAVMRKAAARIVEKGEEKIVVTRSGLRDFLGAPKSTEKNQLQQDTVGVVNGLAWTAVGGTTLCVEVSVMPGKGNLELTGQLGDVMKESAKTAISVVRGMSEQLAFPPDMNEKTDLHIHVPEGAIPKDGPSAGVTMVTAVASALTKRPVRHDIAMTGEITLTGRVLKIGGIKEKALAALRAGIHTVLLPRENRSDLEELPESVRDQIEFVFVDSAQDVLERALVPEEAAA